MNFAEVSAGYAQGKALELLGRGVAESGVDREDLFLTCSCYPVDLDLWDTAEADLGEFLSGAGSGYADSVLVTQSLVIKFGQVRVYAWLNELLGRGVTRYVSFSNGGWTGMSDFSAEFGERVWAHETHLSFEARAVEDAGLLELAEWLCVRSVIWRPLRRGLSGDGVGLLTELAAKYELEPAGVILNWMVRKGLHPLVFSTSPAHIDANLAALAVELSEADYTAIERYRDPRFVIPVRWDSADVDSDLIALATTL
jgi:2,5-diketo-D-gluconate reductase B